MFYDVGNFSFRSASKGVIRKGNLFKETEKLTVSEDCNVNATEYRNALESTDGTSGEGTYEQDGTEEEQNDRCCGNSRETNSGQENDAPGTQVDGGEWHGQEKSRDSRLGKINPFTPNSVKSKTDKCSKITNWVNTNGTTVKCCLPPFERMVTLIKGSVHRIKS